MLFRKNVETKQLHIYKGEVCFIHKGTVKTGIIFGEPMVRMMQEPIYKIISDNKIYEIPKYDIETMDYYNRYINEKVRTRL